MNEDQIRHFHISDILSVTNGRLMSVRHLDGMSDILNFMTGEDLASEQFSRANKHCGPALLTQHPMLIQADASHVDTKDLSKWLTRQSAKYGDVLPVRPLEEGVYQSKKPLVEISEILAEDSK